MLMKNLKIALAFFLVFSFKDFLSGDEIQWINSLVFAGIVFVVYLFWDWAKEPYDWDKHKR
ncbi:hypothetical protein ON064_09265 [Planococcus sp. A6]|uniref:hypothetical protein n=1 Tax=Planococcus sp. A6 TaxID=2992760 RepID=UPI00237A1258|nr:hypothetical protein [Planococcus sp. A6]MDE0583224.1 hypothetical protein [Planococcus sp. A6]